MKLELVLALKVQSVLELEVQPVLELEFEFELGAALVTRQCCSLSIGDRAGNRIGTAVVVAAGGSRSATEPGYSA